MPHGNRAPFQIFLNLGLREDVIEGRSGRRKVAVSEEARRPFVAPVADRHARLPETAGLGRACLATLIALIAQFGLGMWLNLYVPVPSSDQHAGIVQEITNGPLTLTVHALLGTFLIVAAIVLLIRAVRTRHSIAAALTATGLGAILGAFAAGELFVRNGKSSASLWMAVLTGIALLCYTGVQALVSAARMPIARTQAEDRPLPMPRRSYPHPRAAGAAVPPQSPWPPTAGSPSPRRPPAYEPPISGLQAAYRTTAPGSRPRPAYPPQYGYPAVPADMSGPQPSYPPAAPGAWPRRDLPYRGRRRAAPRPDPADYEYPDYPQG
jgi:MFS family permease